MSNGKSALGFINVATKDIQPPLKSHKRFQTDDEDIAGLRDNIREIGLINPISVIEVDDNKYRLVAGARRLKAVKELKWESVPVHVLSVDEFIASFSENMQRFDPSDVEKGFWLKEQIDFLMDKDAGTLVPGKKFKELEKPVEQIMLYLSTKLNKAPRTLYNWLAQAKNTGGKKKTKKQSQPSATQKMKRNISWMSTQSTNIVDKLKYFNSHIADLRDNKQFCADVKRVYSILAVLANQLNISLAKK